VTLVRSLIGPIVIVVFLAALWALITRGNPGGISDAKYSEFKQLPPPKLLYSCTRKPTRESLLRGQQECMQTGRAGCEEKAYESGAMKSETEVEFVAGPRTSGYENLLQKAKNQCATNRGDMGGGEFKVLEASKN
jgi:hypothetical protein